MARRALGSFVLVVFLGGLYLLGGSDVPFAPASGVCTLSEVEAQACSPPYSSGTTRGGSTTPTTPTTNTCASRQDKLATEHGVLVTLYRRLIQHVVAYRAALAAGNKSAAAGDLAQAKSTFSIYRRGVVAYYQSLESYIRACPVGAVLKAPSAPRNLEATAGDRQATLTWKAPLLAGKYTLGWYYIYQATKPGAETYLAKVPATLHTSDATSLANGTTYYFTVKAVSKAGLSPASPEAVATPHTAGTTLAVSPARVFPGEVVQVTGSGFGAGSRVLVALNGTAARPLADPTADSSGAISAPIIVPPVATRTYSVLATQSSAGGTTTASANLAISPRMVFQPASAKGGQATTIGLVGFPADRAVTLRWGSSTGSALANTTTDSAGQALATFTVPSVAAGGYVLYATGTQTTSVFEDFRVSRTTLLPPPTVGALTPGTGTPGTFVRVHAGGLRPNEVVTTIVGGAAVDQSLASSSGSIDVPIIVPAAPNGALPVQVVGAQSGVVVSQSLNVAARLVLVPSAGHAGSSLSADAFGFPAGAPITILWDGSTIGSIGSGNSDPFGSAAVAATVPSGAAGGAHDATATGGSTAASSTFTVN